MLIRVLLAVVVGLCATVASAAPDKVKLALNWKPEPQFGGFYAAEVSRAFARHNLEVEILPGGSGTPTVQMLDAGRVEFGIVSADEIAALRARGGDVVALFAVYQTNPQAIMTHESRGLTSLKQLLESPGTIAWQAGLPYVSHFRETYKLSPGLREVPYQGGLPFLRSADFAQQVFITSEPVLAQAQGHKVTTFLVAESGYNPYTTVLSARGALVRDNPDLVRRMRLAVSEGWRAYLDNPAPANTVMARLNPAMDDATFKASAEVQKPLIETEETKTLGLGAMTTERWQTLLAQLRKYGILEKDISPQDCFLPSR
jgi:NitT/TauT family transport system substrate-binding protein